jgi:putative transposase
MMPITPELLDELLKDYQSPEDMFGDEGLLQQRTKAVVARALQGALTPHLGYEKHDPAGTNAGNSRNGKSKKTIKAKRGQIEIDVPRARASEFAPHLIRKGQTRFDGFADKSISMYASGMTCREIRAHLQEIYGVEVSPDRISTVTDGVIDEVRSWQSRPLDARCPILYLDALQVKVKDQGRGSNKAISLAIGGNMHGIKEVLGLWASDNEGAKFWLSISTGLKNRGGRDIFIACVDGLKGCPEAIEASYPKTQAQLWLVHRMRFSLAYVSFKERKSVAADLKLIYRAARAEETAGHLTAFAEKWVARYPSIATSWRANWARVIPRFGLPADIRRAIYTTNAIESLHMSLRKVIKTRASFPNDAAAFKLLYLALRNIAKKWTLPIPHWGQAMQAFASLFAGRVPTLDGTSFTQFI